MLLLISASKLVCPYLHKTPVQKQCLLPDISPSSSAGHSLVAMVASQSSSESPRQITMLMLLFKGVSSDLRVPSRPSLLQPSTLEPSATTVINPSPIRVVLLPWLNPDWYWYTHQGEATWEQKSRSMQMTMLQVEREASLAGWHQDDSTAGTRVSIRTGPRTPTTTANGVVSNSIREFGLCPEGSGNQWNLPSCVLSRGLEGNQNRKQRPSKRLFFHSLHVYWAWNTCQAFS